MSDPIFAPVPVTMGTFVHGYGVWHWDLARHGRLSPTMTNEADLLAEIVRLRQELAAARCECEHWWQEASR